MKSDVTIKTVPCKRCGKPTSYLGTKLCNGCWEVESRLDDYLRSEKGRQYVHGKLCDLRYKVIEKEIVKRTNKHGT